MKCKWCGRKIPDDVTVPLCSECLKKHIKSKKSEGSIWRVDYNGSIRRYSQCPFQSWEDWKKDDEVFEGEYLEGMPCGKITRDTSMCGIKCPLIPRSWSEEREFNKNRRDFLKKKLVEFYDRALARAISEGY